MEARTGDRAPKTTVAEKRLPPRDRLLPLSYVEFLRPVYVEGCPYPLKTFKRGEELRDANAVCPKLFLDPELQAIVIEGRHFPIHLVFYYERAKAA